MRKKLSRLLFGIALFCFAFGIVIEIVYWPKSTNVPQSEENDVHRKSELQLSNLQTRRSGRLKYRVKLNQTTSYTKQDKSSFPLPNYKVHAFYYAWYGNPSVDQKWLHWNHRYLKYWKKSEAHLYPFGKRHVPPDDIGASFYPLLGPYSSHDPVIIEQHMIQLRSAGIGVLSISWYPPGQADEEGRPAEDIIPAILDTAHQHHIKVCFHVEPFQGRTAQSLRSAVRHVIDTYGSHPALYRVQRDGSQPRPLFYMYDSYQVQVSEWKRILTSAGDHSLRGSKYDAVFLGLLVEAKHQQEILKAGFDGFYTYFSSDSFTYGSTVRMWNSLSQFAKRNNLMFSPSVGPGYDDTRIRPWNAQNTKERQGGLYYNRLWREALTCRPDFVSITSFNEWGEGTQIESAVPKTFHGKAYVDYAPENPGYYLSLTKQHAGVFN